MGFRMNEGPFPLPFPLSVSSSSSSLSSSSSSSSSSAQPDTTAPVEEGEATQVDRALMLLLLVGLITEAEALELGTASVARASRPLSAGPMVAVTPAQGSEMVMVTVAMMPGKPGMLAALTSPGWPGAAVGAGTLAAALPLSTVSTGAERVAEARARARREVRRYMVDCFL